MATHVTRLQIPRRGPHGRRRGRTTVAMNSAGSARGAGVVAGYCRSYATSVGTGSTEPRVDRGKPSWGGMRGGKSRLSAVTLQRSSTGRGSRSAVSNRPWVKSLKDRGKEGGEAICKEPARRMARRAQSHQTLRRRPDMRRGSTFPRASSETTRACSGEEPRASVSELSQAGARAVSKSQRRGVYDVSASDELEGGNEERRVGRATVLSHFVERVACDAGQTCN